jgi:phosphoenolpyruvate carboxylase
LIVSMASEIKHLQVAADLVESTLGDLRLPVIPLFEQADALKNATAVVSEVIRDHRLNSALHRHWRSQLEVMLGYSDSSKESGVLKSRLQVAESMHALEKLCKNQKKIVTPLFFQGSGGSTDRGGGSVEEQTEWWSSSALRNYKVTLQGEIVERSLATPEIIRGQLERIVQSAGRWPERSRQSMKEIFPHSSLVGHFAGVVASHYKNELKTANFLQVIEKATPYPYLNLLKFGSRPTKRSRGVSIEGLRAIPWILCWTQTRMLFPTWWGVGSAWKATSVFDRKQLKDAAKTHPVFSTFVRALEYTLAKVEPAIWKLYLEESKLSEEIKVSAWHSFDQEHRMVSEFIDEITGKRELIGWRPWLRTSIQLRSPMIHPLNLLQIIAIETHDVELLRLSVTGISSGMMTTG